jgi:hypothetical protein
MDSSLRIDVPLISVAIVAGLFIVALLNFSSEEKYTKAK